MTKITLTILGEQYTVKGESIEDALSSFDFDWNEIKGKGSMIVVDGKRSCEKLYSMALLRRIINNKIFRRIQAKNLALLLK